MTNIFTLIPATYRKWLYLTVFALVVVVTAVQVWYTAIPDTGTAPDWTARALAVLGYVGGILGLTAASNVNAGPEDPDLVTPERR